jgi:hypothetical protein
MPPKYELKAKERIRKGLQRYGAILQDGAQRGLNEAETSDIVHAMITELLGYERFREVRAEYMTKGHAADWAVHIGDDLKFFVEVKPLGTKLGAKDLFQVVAYSKQGRDLGWAVLTTGDVWQCHRVAAGADEEMFFEVRVLDAAQPLDDKVGRLYLISKEAYSRDALQSEWEQRECYKPERLARVLLSDEVMRIVRRIVKRENPGRRVGDTELREALARGVIRGDVYAATETAPARSRKRKAKQQPHPASDSPPEAQSAPRDSL